MDKAPAGAELYLDESIASDPRAADRFRNTIANAREVRDARGELLYYEGTVEDISERLVIEDELRLSIERFERASRATHDVIWEWNIASDTLWWSPNVEAVLGWTPKELGSAIEGW